MNASDRRKLAHWLGEAQKALSVLEDLRSAIFEMAEEEEEKYDNLAERGLDGSLMAYKIQDAQTALEEGASGVDEAHSALEMAITELEGVGE
jgi:predicted  nucleic acid-binding Zn-ribbon protein|tara:strand:- start:710 stop:985 length:276 start_codon:yes stop_codon:yes gene_type:complete